MITVRWGQFKPSQPPAFTYAKRTRPGGARSRIGGEPRTWRPFHGRADGGVAMPGAPVRGTLNPAHARRRYCVRRTVERRCRRHRPQSPPVPNRCLLARPPSTVTQGVPIPSRWRHRSPRGFQTIASSIGSQGMNYVFEATVRYLFRRVTRRARPAITLITEKRDAAGNRRELLHPRPHSPRPSTFVITNPDHPDR